MPALPSPGKVLKLIWQWSNQGRNCVNVTYAEYPGAGDNVSDLISVVDQIYPILVATFVPLINNAWHLDGVTAVDLQTPTSPTASHVHTTPGGEGGPSLPVDVALGITWSILRRYRGGRPRIYLPSPGNSALETTHSWHSTVVDAFNLAAATFLTEMAGVTSTAYGPLTPASISYHAGFTNITLPSGRETSRSVVRPVPVVDIIKGALADTRLWSQRRRLGKDVD